MYFLACPLRLPLGRMIRLKLLVVGMPLLSANHSGLRWRISLYTRMDVLVLFGFALAAQPGTGAPGKRELQRMEDGRPQLAQLVFRLGDQMADVNHPGYVPAGRGAAAC